MLPTKTGRYRICPYDKQRNATKKTTKKRKVSLAFFYI